MPASGSKTGSDRPPATEPQPSELARQASLGSALNAFLNEFNSGFAASPPATPATRPLNAPRGDRLPAAGPDERHANRLRPTLPQRTTRATGTGATSGTAGTAGLDERGGGVGAAGASVGGVGTGSVGTGVVGTGTVGAGAVGTSTAEAVTGKNGALARARRPGEQGRSRRPAARGQKEKEPRWPVRGHQRERERGAPRCHQKAPVRALGTARERAHSCTVPTVLALENSSRRACRRLVGRARRRFQLGRQQEQRTLAKQAAARQCRGGLGGHTVTARPLP